MAAQYAKEREMQMIPVTFGEMEEITLSAGDHRPLIREIIESFGPRFTPGGQVLYVHDTEPETKFFDTAKFKALGLTFDSYGKFPDVVLYHPGKSRLVLVDSIALQGPMTAKRRNELSKLFSEGKAGLVFVTAFPNRQSMAKYLAEISWETEAWAADAPTHLIHFNRERFLGPYEK